MVRTPYSRPIVEILYHAYMHSTLEEFSPWFIYTIRTTIIPRVLVYEIMPGVCHQQYQPSPWKLPLRFWTQSQRTLPIGQQTVAQDFPQQRRYKHSGVKNARLGDFQGENRARASICGFEHQLFAAACCPQDNLAPPQKPAPTPANPPLEGSAFSHIEAACFTNRKEAPSTASGVTIPVRNRLAILIYTLSYIHNCPSIWSGIVPHCTS